MTSPRIVVLMSCYNEERYLAETIEAVIGQTVEDVQILILDNGSTDSSPTKLRGLTRFDWRITVLHSDRNLQPGAVMNLLTHVALECWRDCDWFVTAGVDDVMHNDYLEAILAAAKANPCANLIFSPWSYIGGALPDKRFPDLDAETCHAVHQLPAWAAFRRDLLMTAGPWDRDIIAADWDWYVRQRYNVRPHQLERPYISLRVREGERKTQSEEVHWPSLHQHLCRVANKEAPEWARGPMQTC